MDFNTRFPLSRVYKMTPYGLSLHTQEYARKFLDEDEKSKKDIDVKEKELQDESKEDKKKFPKKTETNTEPDDKFGTTQIG